MPYRHAATPVEARFELRTPAGYHVATGLLSAVTIASAALVAWAWLGGGYGPLGVLGVLVIITTLSSWAASSSYRIGGGSGTLVVYSDAIEIPGTFRGSVVRLPRNSLVFARRPAMSMIGGGEIITFASGDQTRSLSTLTSASPGFADKLTSMLVPKETSAAIEKLFGDVFDGRLHAALAEEDAELDRRIDAELEQLDD